MYIMHQTLKNIHTINLGEFLMNSRSREIISIISSKALIALLVLLLIIPQAVVL